MEVWATIAVLAPAFNPARRSLFPLRARVPGVSGGDPEGLRPPHADFRPAAGAFSIPRDVTKNTTFAFISFSHNQFGDAVLARLFVSAPAPLTYPTQLLGRHGPLMLGLLAVALMWLGTGYSVHLSRMSAERAAGNTTANLARAFEQHIIRTIDGVDQSLLSLRASLAARDRPIDLPAWAAPRQVLTDMAFQISIVDKYGRVVATTSAGDVSHVTVSDRDYFRMHAATPDDHLLISKPVLGRVSQKWSLQFTRRLSSSDGAFAGVGIVSLDPSRLMAFYTSLDIGRQGAVVLLGRDGVARAHATQAGKPFDILSDQRFLKRLLDTERETKSFFIRNAGDGIARVVSHRAIAGYPLIVAVGIGESDAFAAHRKQRDFAFGATAALSGLVLALAWRIRAHQERLARARNELRTRSNHYLRVVNGIEDVIFELNSDGSCVFLNSAWTRSTGYGIAETLGRKLSDFVAPEDRARIDFSGGARAADECGGPLRFTIKSGETRWFELRVRPEFSNHETVAGLFGTLTDVTGWYAADLAKRESDARASAIFDSAADGILSLDAEGQIERVNPGLLRMFKAEAADVVGKNISILAPSEANDPKWRSIRHLLARGSLAEDGWWGEMICQRMDESEFPAGLRLSEMQLPSGRHFTCIVRDITERKKIEQIKDNFVATVSHELRTPMTAIVGSLGLIRTGAIGGIPQPALDLIEMAHRNCGRLVRLLDDILDLERIGSGQVDLKLADVDLNQVIADAASLNRPNAEDRGVRIVIHPLDPAPVVRADGDRIMQVVTNLLSNALKYSPSGEAITITVSERKSRYRVSVSDRGPGVPDEFRSQIFKRFARADSSDNRARGGTGLGLSICQLILEQHGGTIDYESAPGNGATFYFELSTGRARAVNAAA